VLTGTGLHVAFGGVVAVGDVDLEVAPGRVLAVVGPNGSGKTTLLNAVTGLVARQGRVVVDGDEVAGGRPAPVRAAGVLRTFQTPQVLDELSCIDNVLLATSDRRRRGLAASLVGRPGMLAHERSRWADAARCLDRYGLGAAATAPASELTYGQRRWLELARVELAGPRYLLADEPSAGLNDAETDRLAGHLRDLRDQGVGIALVDHKVDFLRATADRALVLSLGRVVAEAAIDEVWDDPAVQEAYLGSRRARR
jgi:ABC-type branched-subunit amino acid transport system ATPase component